MLDIKFIRENPKLVEEKSRQKGYKVDVKKLLDVSLEHKTGPRPVSCDLASRSFQSGNAFVGAKADTARKRGRDKSFLENGIYYGKYGMMQNAVANFCLVNVPLFRIANIKTGIRSVLVCFISKIAVELKDVFLDVPLETDHVPLVSFIALKGIPR